MLTCNKEQLAAMIPSTVIFFVWSFCLLNTLSPITVTFEETGDENTFTLLFSTLKPALLKQKSSMCLPGRISKTVFNGGEKTLLWQLRHVRQVVHARTHTHNTHMRARKHSSKYTRRLYKSAMPGCLLTYPPFRPVQPTCAETFWLMLKHKCRL